jgi:dihydropyrimidine dehydrogenase (NAD+) subunit PreA
VEAESRRKITVTPAARLDQGPFPTPIDRVPRVDEEECVGCNLCWLVCPVEGCISMEAIDTGLPPESWDERCRKAAAPQSRH